MQLVMAVKRLYLSCEVSESTKTTIQRLLKRSGIVVHEIQYEEAFYIDKSGKGMNINVSHDSLFDH